MKIETSLHKKKQVSPDPKYNISHFICRSTSQVVADFGCGEAVIARSVANKVHSFDLVANNEFVTACNMAKVSWTKKKTSNNVWSYRLTDIQFGQICL